jgi:hypothetical protein
MVKLSELRNSAKLGKNLVEQVKVEKKKKVAIIFRGESYRDAIKNDGIHSRTIGTQNTVKGQKAANNNHCDLIDYTKKKYDIDIDVFIDTQSTRYDYSLIEDYKKRNIYVRNFAFHTQYCKTQMLSIQRSVNHILCNEDVNDYQSVLVLRNDIFLKPCFFDLYNPFHKKVHFSFIAWKSKIHPGRTLGGYPRVGDIMYYIPKKYFLLLEHFKSINPPGGERVPAVDDKADDPKSGGWGHEAIYYWDKILPEFEYDFYIKTFHDSNPAVDLNPLYYMVNRKVANKYLVRQDKIYPDNFYENF